MGDNADGDPLSTGGAFDVLAGVFRESSEGLIGRELGDYRVTALIGEGGMGRVYRAERIDGSFEREVAVKISAGGAVSGEMRSRFLQEQSVLAALNHQNICQLYDARVSAGGLPYFVMEFVDGKSIVDYCEDNELGTDERIGLLIDIVDAVAYAHSKLVVHRDIKPANVLVNADGQAKLLDFGIAKLLESDGALTQTAPLTPRYASPEQLLGQPVTVGSDIAQLGLLIYEVLTGSALNADESLADAIQRAAANQSLRIESGLAGAIPREVLPIIEQCLRADPTDRYRDANSLKTDLEAYRQGYPVSAVGQSAWYRTRKLVTRNIATTVAGAMTLVAVSAGTAWYTWQLQVARDEARRQAEAADLEAARATQISDFFTSLFTEVQPQDARGQDVLVSDVMDRGIERIRSELADQDDLRASILVAVGEVKNELGEFEHAAELTDEAIAIRRRLHTGEDPVPLAKALYLRGIIDWYSGQFDGSSAVLAEAIALCRSVDTEASAMLLTGLLNTAGMVASQNGLFGQALDLHEQSYELRKRVFGAGHWEVAASAMNIGAVYAKLGRYDEALPTFQAAYDSANTNLPEDDPRISRPAMWLGRTLMILGKNDEALPYLARAVDIEGKVWGKEHTNYGVALLNYANLLDALGRYREAASVFEESLDIQKNALEPEHFDIGIVQYQLAGVYTKLGRLEAAEVLLEAANANLGNAFPDGHRLVAYAVITTGRLYEATGRPAAAIQAYREGADMLAAKVGQNHPHIIEPLMAAGRLLVADGRLDAAIALYERALVILEANTWQVPDWRPFARPYLTALSAAGDDRRMLETRDRLASARTRLCDQQGILHAVCDG